MDAGIIEHWVCVSGDNVAPVGNISLQPATATVQVSGCTPANNAKRDPYEQASGEREMLSSPKAKQPYPEQRDTLGV